MAWLALTGVVYLVVFVNGRRREHGWLALQSLLAATYSLWVLDQSEFLTDGATRIAVLGGALCVACAASVAFTHNHFGLPSAGRVWPILAGLGVVAGILTRAGWVPAHAMAAVTLLVIAAALTHQISSLRRLATLNARLLVAAWIVLAVAIAIDVASWLADVGAFGEPARMSASIVGLTTLAFLYTVALARQHGRSLEESERQRRELAHRLETIETKSREIEGLNQELRRQIGLRSHQLAAALATLGARTGGLAVGSEIAGRYRVLGHLGTGGMGLVYEVARLTDGRRFALKLLHGHAKPAVVARFAREAEILAQLHHPNLIAIVDVDVSSDGQLFIVMELVDGVALDIACDEARDLGWRVHVLTEIAAGLVAIHGAGIVHRDLKPANILIAGRVVKIADFGVSSFDAKPGDNVGLDVTVDALTATGAIMGTPRYMAPELAAGGGMAAFPVDVFAFGVLAYELLSGQPPYKDGAFTLHAQGVANQAPASLVEHAPGLPVELATLVHDCLAWDRLARPAAGTVLDRLRALPAMPALATPARVRAPTAPTLALGSTTLPPIKQDLAREPAAADDTGARSPDAGPMVCSEPRPRSSDG